uniref:Uncharacterized protein n=1 Tax=mine drainage metagenome TaxID=410659 RepID=E6PZ67_9ZZZZ
MRGGHSQILRDTHPPDLLTGKVI